MPNFGQAPQLGVAAGQQQAIVHPIMQQSTGLLNHQPAGLLNPQPVTTPQQHLMVNFKL